MDADLRDGAGDIHFFLGGKDGREDFRVAPGKPALNAVFATSDALIEQTGCHGWLSRADGDEGG
jgi:hypothetical protein